MGSLSISHWLIVALVVLLVFGPKKLSEVGKGLGQGVRNFKAGLAEETPARHDSSPTAGKEQGKAPDAP